MKSLLDHKLLFFGGKGGVGKTTMATATAIASADSGKRTLLVSTDPAHSVSDSLDQIIGGDSYIPVKNVPNLFAIEIDSAKTVKEYSEVLQTQDSTGIISEFLGTEDPSLLSPPGTDETIAFIQLLQYIQNPEFDLIIFDTAPTGHTLKLLKLPELTQSWLYRTIKMRQRMSGMIRGVKTLFGSSSVPSEDEAFDKIEELKNNVESAREYLADSSYTEFIAVTIPTIMAIWETERLIRALHEVKFPISKIYINQIQPENKECRFCRTRYENHRRDLERIHALYDDYDLVEIPLFDHELRGIDFLRELADFLYKLK